MPIKIQAGQPWAKKGAKHGKKYDTNPNISPNNGDQLAVLQPHPQWQHTPWIPVDPTLFSHSHSCVWKIRKLRANDLHGQDNGLDFKESVKGRFFHNQIIKHPWNIPKQCWTANSPGKNLSKHHAQRTCFFSQHRNLPVGQGITLKKHSWHAKCTFNMPQSSSKRFLRHYPSSFWSLFWTRKKCDSMGNVLLPQ